MFVARTIDSKIRSTTVRCVLALVCTFLFVCGYLFYLGYFAENMLLALEIITNADIMVISHREAVILLQSQPWFDNFEISIFALGGLGILFWLFYIYRLWTVLPGHRTPFRPLHATLPLVIPVFNIYWLFVALMGFAKAANSVLRLRGIDHKDVSIILSLCAATTFWFSFVPRFGKFFLVAFLVCAFLFAVQSRAAAIAVLSSSRLKTTGRAPRRATSTPVLGK